MVTNYAQLILRPELKAKVIIVQTPGFSSVLKPPLACAGSGGQGSGNRGWRDVDPAVLFIVCEQICYQIERVRLQTESTRFSVGSTFPYPLRCKHIKNEFMNFTLDWRPSSNSCIIFFKKKKKSVWLSVFHSECNDLVSVFSLPVPVGT